MKTLLSLTIGLLLCLTARADVTIGNYTFGNCVVNKSPTNTIQVYLVCTNSELLCMTFPALTNSVVWITNVTVTTTNIIVHTPIEPEIPDAVRPLFFMPPFDPQVVFTNGQGGAEINFAMQSIVVVLTSPYNSNYSPNTAMLVGMHWRASENRWWCFNLGRLLPPED